MRNSLKLGILFVVLVIACCASCLGQDREDSYEMERYENGLASDQRCQESRAHPPQTAEEQRAAEMSSDSCQYPSETFRFGVGLFEGLARIRRDGKVGYITSDGRVAIPAKFDEGGRFSEGLARVRIDGKWGFINGRGTSVIAPRFVWACSFFAGRAVVKIGEKWGYINKQGEVVIQPRFDNAWSFSGGLAHVQIYKQKYKSGYINTSGRWILQPTFDGGSDFHQGVAIIGKDIVSNSGGSGYSQSYVITSTGRRLFELDSWYLSGYSEGRLVVADTVREFGFLNLKGRLVIPHNFSHAGSFSEGLAAVVVEDRWVYINRKGVVVLRPESRCSGPFLTGLAPCEEGDKYGFIDRTGKFVIAPRFNWVDGFRNELASVFVGDQAGYINRKGQYVWPPSD